MDQICYNKTEVKEMTQNSILTNFILDQGVAQVGYSNLAAVLPEKYQHLKSGITLVVRLADEVISEIDIKNGPTHTYFHHYRTVNAFIDQVSLKVVTKLQQWGYLALAVPASQSINVDGWEFKGLFPHRTGAVMSGLGWIGKNCCLVTDEFGPRVRLGTILTNMELEYGKPINESQCGACDACVRACPAIALKGKLWEAGDEREALFDPRACSTHMHQQYQKIGRGSVCGICVKVCPRGKKVLKR